MSESVKKERHLPGEEGVWILILGDLLVFTLLFAVFLYYRSLEVPLFNASSVMLNQAFGIINTLFLLTSSLLVVLGLQSIRIGKQLLAPRFFCCSPLLRYRVSVVKILEYREKISAGYTLHSDNFFMFYYVLTGTHFLHVIVGLVVLGLMIALSRKQTLSMREMQLLEGGGCYWHLVDLLWIILFPLLYLMK
jgi:nitric oxide reductase NorE protein